tara:strand:+ start:134 stop:856 length:723 start_codon:yes stop_codon:yes gene_type:complete
MTHEQVIAKVQKLLALATSSNEHEAALAAERANDLLTKHNLTIAQVPDPDTGAPTTDPIGHANATTKHKSPWVRHLWQATAKLNFCDYMYSTQGHGTYHYIIGTAANSAATCLMAEYLTTTVIKLARAATLENCGFKDNTYDGAFRKGCAARVSTRLRERMQAQQTPSSSNPGNLPALYETMSQAVARYSKDTFGPTKTATARKTRTGNMAGYLDGRDAGDKVGLDTQVARNSQRAIGNG